MKWNRWEEIVPKFMWNFPCNCIKKQTKKQEKREQIGGKEKRKESAAESVAFDGHFIYQSERVRVLPNFAENLQPFSLMCVCIKHTLCIWRSSFLNFIYFSQTRSSHSISLSYHLCRFLFLSLCVCLCKVYLFVQNSTFLASWCKLALLHSLFLSPSFDSIVHKSEILNSLIVVNGPTQWERIERERAERRRKKNGKWWLKCSLNLVIAHQLK